MKKKGRKTVPMDKPLTYTFRRYELKYLITPEQRARLLDAAGEKLIPDDYGRSSVRNIYFDTPDRRIIRNSIDAVDFKEKLRIRSYGAVTPDGTVFVELKRKCEGLVYKRRSAMSETDALDYLFGGGAKNRSQITDETDCFLGFYGNLEPAAFISSEREAFFGADDRSFRVTFDDTILWRDREMSLEKEAYGDALLPEGRILLEIKISSAIPLWLSRFLSENAVFRTSFSKYGTAYAASLHSANKKGTVL